jgi:hypothetical protein
MPAKLGAVSLFQFIPSFRYAGVFREVVLPGQLKRVALKAVVCIEYTVHTIGMVGPENYQFHFFVFKGSK